MQGVWFGILKERDLLGGVWKNNIKMNLKEIGRDRRLDLSGSGKTKVASSCERDEK